MADTKLQKMTQGHPDEELLFALEPDQIVAASSQPLPRYVIGRGTNAALWLLRVCVLIVSGLVVYTFVESLR